jgi:hypothetical protein
MAAYEANRGGVGNEGSRSRKRKKEAIYYDG